MNPTDDILGRCWHCGAGLGPHDYGRETGCPGCGRPTRVCRNCRWYDTSRANACQEYRAEPVTEKERANFCEFFEPTTPATAGGPTPEEELRRAAESLFKL
ncbi:MAG TPA: hypothetical protein ENI96_15685 [Sedimenticola thiotaurini]|uniref:Uncharacterized protein n=1 Tax=Sedimenticola thiotaurini TaxID=1543721 RepID=A0A831RRN6_9GAMM|nr:hypothetical protein [Sedimenticola thiotaurini]